MLLILNKLKKRKKTDFKKKYFTKSVFKIYIIRWLLEDPIRSYHHQK